jgi:molybdopterin-guanine dinucleotide biosynthesis protein A
VAVTNGANIIPIAIIAGYVLAGGGSTRFGFDKARAEIGGQAMLKRMCRLIDDVTGSASVVAAPGRYGEFDVRVVDDLWPGHGPLGGITTALMATAETNGGRDWNLIVGCDMPFLTREWLSHLVHRALASDAEVVAPQSQHGLEPMCACWRTSATGKLQDAFEDGVRKVTDAMKRLRMEILDETHWKRFDSAGRLFWNMNTPQDYEAALRMWREEHG